MDATVRELEERLGSVKDELTADIRDVQATMTEKQHALELGMHAATSQLENLVSHANAAVESFARENRLYTEATEKSIKSMVDAVNSVRTEGKLDIAEVKKEIQEVKQEIKPQRIPWWQLVILIMALLSTGTTAMYTFSKVPTREDMAQLSKDVQSLKSETDKRSFQIVTVDALLSNGYVTRTGVEGITRAFVDALRQAGFVPSR